MWCVAELDEEDIAKMEDVLTLYEKPYRSAEPVICLDEKPVSLHADVRPCRPARAGHSCGTANIFALVEPKAGRHFNCATPNRSAAQFAQVVQRLVAGRAGQTDGKFQNATKGFFSRQGVYLRLFWS